MLIDMHTHTSYGSPDSTIAIGNLIPTAKQRGLDGICITEHRTLITDINIEELCIKHDFKIFRGVEVDFEFVHLLCYGTDLSFNQIFNQVAISNLKTILQQLQDELANLSESIPIETFLKTEGIKQLKKVALSEDPVFFIEKIHDNSGLLFWAHPFNNYSLLGRRFSEYIEKYNSTNVKDFYNYIKDNDDALLTLIEQVDGFEVLSGTLPERGTLNYFAMKFVEMIGKQSIGGSDCHCLDDVGRVGTKFNCNIENEEDFLYALKQDQTEPLLTEYGRSSW